MRYSHLSLVLFASGRGGGFPLLVPTNDRAVCSPAFRIFLKIFIRTLLSLFLRIFWRIFFHLWYGRSSWKVCLLRFCSSLRSAPWTLARALVYLVYHSDRLAYDLDQNECDLEAVFAEIIRKHFVNICIFGQPLSYPALAYHRILPYCALPKSNPVPIFWQPMFSTLPQLPTIAMGKQLLQHYFSNTIVRIANGREREFF